MTVRRILLCVSTSRYSRMLVERALLEAKRYRDAGDTAEIDVLTIREEDELERISKMVGDEGFLGLNPQREVLQTLGDEHDRMARRRVDEVEAAAKAADVTVTRYEVGGQFVAQVMEHAEQLKSDIILISRAERPFISRILFGSEADRVAKLARRDGLGRVIIDDA